MDKNSIYNKLHNVDFEHDYQPTAEQFDLISILSKDDFGGGICEKLVETAPAGTDHNRLAMYMNILSWESRALCQEASECVESWVNGDDKFKIRVALSNELEWYPFQNNKIMEKTLKDLSARHPEFKDRCEELIETRKKTKARNFKNKIKQVFSVFTVFFVILFFFRSCATNYMSSVPMKENGVEAVFWVIGFLFSIVGLMFSMIDR